MTPIAANCSMLFTELPLAERPDAARAAGFAAIELWWPFERTVPDDAEVTAFVRCIRESGVPLVAMNLAAGDLAAGERGLMSIPGREQELRDSVDVAAVIVAELGVRACNALYGARLDGVDPARQDDLALANYAYVDAALRHACARILIEPLSGVPAYPLRTAGDVIALLDRLGPDVDARLLADLYHLAVNGDDVDAVIATHADRIGHVQIADAPGRHEPDTGTLPLRRWIAALRRAGYDGWVALEYEPAAGTQAGLASMNALEEGTYGP